MTPEYENWTPQLLNDCRQLLLIERQPFNPVDYKKLEDEVNKDFLCQIIKKRIEVFKIPIRFNLFSFTLLTLISENPARIIVTLIDLLNRFELTNDSPVEDISVMDVLLLYNARKYSQSYFDYLVEKIQSEPKKGWNRIYTLEGFEAIVSPQFKIVD